MTPSKERSLHSPQALILFGPPGAGKGTQASLISDKLDYHYLETSKLLEQRFASAQEGDYVEADGKKYSLLDEKKIWGTGVLNSPPFVTRVVAEAIRGLHESRTSVLLAGSPRTLYEAKAIIPLLDELYGRDNLTIIMLELKEEETIERNSKRRICELMRHPILALEETEKLTQCPLDGSRLVRREGLDDPENIKTRLRQYAERTYPMLEYFTSEGFKVHKIDGGKAVGEVFSELMRIVA